MVRVSRLIQVCVLLLGAALLAQGLWIPAKARVAQVLLEHSWQQVLAGNHNARPWPWADGRPLARLRWPKGGVSQIILGQASGRTLAFAPGHVPPSVLPGQSGHSVVSAHRDTHFAFLGALNPGDQLTLEFAGGTHHYQVTDRDIIDLATHRFELTPERNRLTLVTCYPLDGWSSGTAQRLLIHMDRVST